MRPLDKTEQLIEFKGPNVIVQFRWSDYDGDDFFKIHTLRIEANGSRREFSFQGGGVVHTLRNVAKLSEKTDSQEPLHFFSQSGEYKIERRAGNFSRPVLRKLIEPRR
jgi:hypothetical protein